MLLEKALQLIDEKNALDPNKETYLNQEYPKELLYSKRMFAQLLDFDPDASEELKIAIRAQHIGRWEIPRSDYPSNKIGYIKWRNELKKKHASLTTEILNKIGYSEEFSKRVSFLINKKALKNDPETQTLEDVACLVFLEYYFESFSLKHDEEKIIDIVKKTWNKMSDKGHEYALKLNLSASCQDLVGKALQAS
ncbi:MAG: DUF4202 domain-containing protein [Flavobacteriales bacterium]|nr:DUF4202 domain-containing protein [Flavobacteriales bacterium]